MVDRLLFLSLQSTNSAMNLMKFAESELFTCPLGDIISAGCCILCCVELVVGKQWKGEDIQTTHFLYRVTVLFGDIQSFPRLPYPFLVET